ncbi:hypothetical protein NL676_039286 [Syzygium grande]|nr:hypothetical protein NL676_039286 [Syzygium grande]
MATEDVVVKGVGIDRRDVPVLRFAPVTAGGSSKSDAISVEQYTEDEDDDYDVRVLDSFPAETRFSSLRKRKKKPFSGSSVTEMGQRSNSKPDPPFICEVCAVPGTNEDPFRIAGCGHACCNDCVTKHVASKLHDNVTRVGCPIFGGLRLLEQCTVRGSDFGGGEVLLPVYGLLGVVDQRGRRGRERIRVSELPEIILCSV